MGTSCKKQGNFPEALKCYKEVGKIREKNLGKQHPDYAKVVDKIEACKKLIPQKEAPQLLE